MNHQLRAVAVMLAFCAWGRATPVIAQREPARVVVLAATRAVQGDSAERMAARWSTRLRRDPGDRAAMLGLAEIARLTYTSDAEARYRRVCNPPARADPYCAYARLGLGELIYGAGRTMAAVAQMDSAGEVARRAGDRTAEALAAMRSGYMEATVGGPEAAAAGFAAAERLLPADAPDVRAELLYRRAVLLAMEAKPGARAVADSSIALARRARDPALEAAAYNASGIQFLIAQQFDSALAMMRRSADLYGRARDRYHRGIELLRVVGLLREFAELGEAKALSLEARADGEASRNPLVVASSSIGLGAIALQVGDYPAALEELGRARRQFEALADTASLSVTDYFEGLARAGAGDLPAARRLLIRATEFFRGYGDLGNYFDSLRGLVHVLTQQRDWPAAEAALAQARTLAIQKRQPQWLPGLHYDEGHLALVRGDLPAAERLLTAYLATVDTSEHLRRHNTGFQLAEVYARRGELDRAESAVAAAGAELDRWRASIPDRALRVYAFQAKSQDVDDRGASKARVLNALAMGRREAAAFQLAERSRARELGDALARAAALRAGVGSTGSERLLASKGSARTAAVPSVRELLAALPDTRTALLEYVAGHAGAATTVFVATRTGLSARTLAPLDSLAPAIARFKALLESGADPRDLARSLGTSVLGPALNVLPPGITHLIVVLDGELHRLPFDALRLPDGRYVLERYAISTAPSAAVLLALWGGRGGGGKKDAREATLLAFGDPAFAVQPERDAAGGTGPASPSGGAQYRGAATAGLPRLPESGREARLVARYVSAGEVRLREDASAAFLKQAPLEQYQVIHFATHAIVDERSAAGTALALAPGVGESGFVGPGDLAALRLRADLVVLSACRTASGVLVGGEGVEGLTRPLLEAGARAIVASSWRVADRPTVDLVRDFYDALARGQSAGDALRAAKLASLRRGEPASMWAAFGLIGDPLVTVSLREPPARWPWLLLAGAALLGAALAARKRPRGRTVRLPERADPPSVTAVTHER